jgi:hypothetical protein
VPKLREKRTLTRLFRSSVFLETEFFPGIGDDTFRTLILGILLGVLLVAAGVYFYFATGHAPVAVTDPPMPFERKFASIGLHAYLIGTCGSGCGNLLRFV